MRVLNAHLFDSTKSVKPQAGSGKVDAINPKIYLKIMNYNLEMKRLRIYSFLSDAFKVVSQRLLSAESLDYYGGASRFNPEFESEQLVKLDAVNKIDASSHKEAFYDPQWGFAINQRDAELKLRESNLGLKFTNTILHYLGIYNQLNRLTLFGKMLVTEVNKNVSLVTGTGLNGMLFASTLSANPSYSPSQFVRNLYKMLGENGLRSDDIHKRIDQLRSAAEGIEDSQISTLEKRLFNPLFDSKFDEWAGNLYGFSGKFSDKLNTFRVIVENLAPEIDNISDLIIESKKDLSVADASISPENPLFEILEMLSDIAINHLSYLAHIVTNMYFGIEAKTMEDSQELTDVVRRIINSVSGFLYNLHLNSVYTKDATQTATQAYKTILMANYFALFTLSQFSEDSYVSVPKAYYTGLNAFLKLVISESQEQLEVAVQCYTLLVKIQPDVFNATDLEVLLSHLKNAQLADGAYRAICGFLVTGLGLPKLKKQIATQQTLNVINSCSRFFDRPSFWQMTYYKGEQRDPEFCNWLWTLNVVIHAFGPLKEATGSLDPILAFVRTYLNRILSVLGFQMVNLDLGQTSTRVLDGDVRTRNECFRSTAYVEELELTLTLLDLLFCE